MDGGIFSTSDIIRILDIIETPKYSRYTTTKRVRIRVF